MPSVAMHGVRARSAFTLVEPLVVIAIMRMPRLLTLVSRAAVSLTLVGTCDCDAENALAVQVAR